MTALPALLAFSLAAADPAGPPGARTTTIPLEGDPRRLVALPAEGDALDVLLVRGREVGRFRVEGRKLVRTGTFLAPGRRWRPLFLDAARPSGSADAVVAVVLGDDVQSVDQGTDTALHSFVLAAGRDGGLAPASADLGRYLRIVDGKVHAQARATYQLFAGPVQVVEGAPGQLAPAGPPVPWASRWILEATPLAGGAEMLAWDGGTPLVVARGGGAPQSASEVAVDDLGAVREPQLAIRLEQPVFRYGMDKEGRVNQTWFAVPRRVATGADGALYVLRRGRRGGSLFGKASGEDAVVRLDRGTGELALARPFPGVAAWILDFAAIERPGGAPAVLLLVNDKEDGSGRAQLVLQEPG